MGSQCGTFQFTITPNQRVCPPQPKAAGRVRQQRITFYMSFTDLGRKPELARAVAEKGYVTPTPIQREAIPAVLAGRDVLAGAQTGTGKTAAFILPILQNLASRQARAPRALVLTPTRELPAQGAETARDYRRHTG